MYAEFCTTWVTADTESNIQVWNLEKETYKALPKHHTKPIVDMKEVPQYKVIAVCSLDKLIILWDIIKMHVVQEIKLESVSVHSLTYSVDFRVMFSAGYENNINIWAFDTADCYHTGELNGHNAQVTAIEVIKDTPLLISADEIGFIKTWDIRNMTCFQTIHFESKGSIKTFLYVNSQKFIGADIRLHWFEFEDPLVVNTNGIDIFSTTPVAAQFSEAHDELLVATKSDVRIIDIFTGKIKKILANVKCEGADISHLIMYPNHKKFIIGDTGGNIVTYDKHNGNVYSKNVCHNNEISCLEMDKHNKMLISSGLDSSIRVQKETCKRCDEIKHVKNAHFGEYISAMCFSLHLSLIASSASGIILFWQYEHMKLIGACSNQMNEIIFMSFIEPYSLLVSLDRSNEVVIWHLTKPHTFAVYDPLIKITLDGIEKNVIMKMCVLTRHDIEDITPQEQRLPFVKGLDKRFRGEPINEKQLLYRSESQISESKILEEDKEDADSLYITATDVKQKGDT